MCKTGPHLKLCTCDPSNLGEYYWRLQRGSSLVETPMWVGSISPPENLGGSPFLSVECFIGDRLLFDINNSPVFDFSYTPEDGDTLLLSLGGDREFDLVFKDGQFEFIDMGVSSRNDGENLGAGAIKYP